MNKWKRYAATLLMLAVFQTSPLLLAMWWPIGDGYLWQCPPYCPQEPD